MKCSYRKKKIRMMNIQRHLRKIMIRNRARNEASIKWKP